MLILSRGKGQEILIGDTATVTVLAIEGNQVKLGIDADRSVVVDRAEVRDRRIEEGVTNFE